MADLPLYYGNSMYRVFTAGERLVLKNISFDELLAGDVITINIPGQRLYVHRVIRKDQTSAVTMGDNNPEPDEYIVTAQSDFQLVTAALTSSGKRREISRGKNGMRVFYSNRRRRKMRLLLRKVLCSCEKLLFWRMRLQDKKIFGSDVCYYWKSRAVARKTANGKIVYQSWKDYLRFRVSEDS